MPSLKFDLLMNDANVQASLAKDKESMEKFGTATEMTDKQMQNFVQAIAKAGGSTSGYKRQLAQVTKQISDLTINYRSLTDEEKNSEFGQKMFTALLSLKKQAGDFKDAIADVQQEIAALASDTPVWDSVSQGIDLASSSAQAFVSVTELAGGSTEELVAVLAKLAQIQTVANAAIKVGNALQAQSKLMIGVRKVQEVALTAAINIRTAAEGKGVIATKAATVAQKAFNLVAKANPYVLLATAIIGVGTALYAFVQKQKAATEEEKRLQKESEITKRKLEEQKHTSDTLGQKTGDLIGKFKSLQIQWSNLRTEGQKKQFIEDNKTAFNQLGLSVTTLNDAYSVLVKNAPQVIAALKAMAEAEAYKDLYKESITKREKEWNNRQKSVETGDYYNKVTEDEREQSGLLMPKEWEEAGLKYKEDYTTEYENDYSSKWKLTAKGEAKINKIRNDAALARNKQMQKYYDDDVKHYEDAYDAAIKKSEEAQSKVKQFTPTTNGKGKGDTTTKITYEKGSLSEAQDEVKKLRGLLDGMSPNNPKFEETNKKLKEAEKKVAEIKKLLEETEPRTAAEELVHSYEKAVDEINKTLAKVDAGLIDVEAAKKKIDAINASLKAAGQKPIEVTFETKGSAPGVSDQSATVTIDVVANDDDLKRVENELDKLQDKKVKVDVETTNTNTTVNKTSGSAPTAPTDSTSTMTVDFVANTDLLIKTYETAAKKIQDIAKQQKIGIISEDAAQKSIDVINNMLKNLGLRTIDVKLDAQVKEGSLKDITDKISALDAKIQVETDDSEIKKLQDELNKLEKQKREISFKLTIEDVDNFKKGLDDIKKDFDNKDLIWNLNIKTQSEKAIADADILGNKYYSLKNYIKNNEDAYNKIIKKSAEFRTEAEKDFVSQYVTATREVNKLGQAYEDAAKKANKLQVNKLSFDGFKEGISAIGNISSGIGSLKNSWTDMCENWNDMSAFEQTISVIDNVCSTFETLISMYESVNEVIKIFQAISEAASASKIASNTAEMASDSALTASDTTNTAIKVANNTTELTSNLATMATEEGEAIAGATSSGASLPFPANIAAIAAGIAAVVAALAMISSFADGGIIGVTKANSGAILGGPTTMGDHTLFYGNKGEMVLNNRQLANLFRMLNSGSTTTVNSGNVEFKIKGAELVGVLNNYNNKKRHV